MAINKELGLFLTTPLNKPIAYYILISLISTLLGSLFLKVDLKTGFFFVLKYFEYVLVYFMVLNHLKTRRQARAYLWALLITCTIVSFLGLAQAAQGGRVSAPFEGDTGEPNTFGGYLLLMASVTTGLLLTTKSFRMQMTYGAMAFLFVVTLFFTGSRSSLLGLILAALVFLWLSEKRGLVFFGLVAVAVILPFTAPKTLTKRVSQTFTQRADRRQITVAGTRLDMSTSARLMQMQNVLRDFTQHPVLGFGVTGYKFVDAQYFKVLIETGLIGLFIFFLLLLSIFRLTYRVFKVGERTR